MVTDKRTAARLFAYLFTIAFLTFVMMVPDRTVAVTLSAGDLIKLADDGNPETTSDSAVYYYGADGKRYVFPNSQTYFTWYGNFSSVRTVDAGQLASIQIGGNVTYRPGTRLVKIVSDPKVYAVEPGGTLRPIDSEAIANALYGNQWNRMIDDVPDAFFFNYNVGSPLTAAVYPEGSVVRRTSDGALFRIEDRNKRLIASDEVRQALRIQEQFILGDGAGLTGYPDGNSITTAESSITDTSQRIRAEITSIPTFSLVSPASNYASVGGDTTFIELRISSAVAVSVRSMKVRLEGIGSESTVGPEDFDVGGLVYGNNAQANVKLIRFIDESGAEPFGRRESVTLDVNQDQSQTFSFNGNFTVPAGTERRLFLKAQLNSLLPTGLVYKATLVIDGVQVIDSSDGSVTVFGPTTDIAGANLTTLNANMDVTSYTVPGGKTVVRGANLASIGGLSLKATKEAPNVVNRIKLQGYIDEEGIGGFLPGGDSDNGSTTLVRELIPRVYLYAGDILLAGPAVVDLNGQAIFSGLSYHIAAGSTANLTIKGDTNINVQLEDQPDRVSFDVLNSRTDIDITDDSGGTVTAVGELPNGGSSPKTWLTVVEKGKLDFRWQGGGGPVVAGRDLDLGMLTVVPEYDSYDLKLLAFKVDGYPLKSFPGPVTLTYPDASGQTVSATAQLIGGTVTFSNLPALVSASTQFRLSGKVLDRTAGALYGEQIKFSFAPEAGLNFISKTDDGNYGFQDIDGDRFKVSLNTASTWSVRYSGLTAAMSASTPTHVWLSYPEELLKFSMKADPEGNVRIKKLVFKLTPSDGGSSQTVGGVTTDIRDSLEKWAGQWGDSGEDDGFCQLEWVSSSGNRQLIGETSSGSIRYYPKLRSGAAVTDTVNYVSTYGDYALVEYVLSDGQEWTVPAGVTHDFSFQISMSDFYASSSNTIKVDLLGASDFLWTDISSGAYTALTGSQAWSGLPMTKTLSVN